MEDDSVPLLQVKEESDGGLWVDSAETDNMDSSVKLEDDSVLQVKEESEGGPWVHSAETDNTDSSVKVEADPRLQGKEESEGGLGVHSAGTDNMDSSEKVEPDAMQMLQGREESEGGLWVHSAETDNMDPSEKPSSSDESSDEFNKPDPDSSDEWLLSGSTGSSRASSPDGPQGQEEDCASSRDPTPFGSAKKKGCASSWGHGQDSGWYQTNWQPNKIPFTATPGARNAAAELDSDRPSDFLELFLTDELLQHIVDQTNLYAKRYFEARPVSLPHSRGNAWKPVSVTELKTFFGLSFLTSYIKKPNLELYWSMDEVDATPYFNQTMSRNRFQIIWRFLHYNDNASQNASDKLYKVRPVLDYVVKRFRELYQPGENICIDEGMMRWRGRLSFRVYNPQKPVKYGIKSYILCDSATGYCFNMQPDVGEAGADSETVFSLLDRLAGHGYTLYMDNFYSSVALCERLLGAETNVCGTLRKNRGEPKVIGDVTKADLGVGERVVRHNERVLVVAWKGKRLVKMVTTCHHDSMQRAEGGRKRPKHKVPQLKPECVVAYSSCMNGVDKLDQNVAYFPFIRRSVNWSKKFVAYLIQICMFNAYVLFRDRHPGECKTLLEFMRRVVKSWTAKRHVSEKEDLAGEGIEGDEDSEKGQQTVRAPYNSDPDSRLDGQMARHRLERLMPTNTSRKSRPTRRCRVCTRRGKRSDTRFYCKACCVPLHPGECYTAYHSRRNYSA